MGPLVYYCRWRNAKLRLRGRDEQSVWGHLVTTDQAGREAVQEFHYILQTRELILVVSKARQRLQLDEMGVVITTIADDEPQ